MKTPFLLLGYGNTLRRDDGAGVRVAELLRLRLSPRACQVMTTRQLLPEMASMLPEFEQLIFVDAQIGGPVGQVQYQPVTPDADTSSSVTHQLSPFNLIELCAALYGDCPQAVLFSITGGDFGFGYVLSPPVLNQIPYLVSRIQAHIVQYIQASQYSEVM